MTFTSSAGEIEIKYDPVHHDLSLVGLDDSYALRAVLGATIQQPYLLRTVQAIFSRSRFCVEDFLFRYCTPAVLDPGEQPWEGVQLATLEDLATIPETEFETLAIASYRLLLQHLPMEGRVSISTQERKEIERLVAAIEQRNSSP